MIFQNLMNLVDSDGLGFYFVDQVNQNGSKVRIFGYRMASYSDWLKPSALEARGITFNIDDLENPRIICRPMDKFFNLNENPFTQNLNIMDIKYLMFKEDGSLISFYWDGEVQSKSKMSCFSQQALDSLELLKTNQELYDEVERLTKAGYTLNFEYVSPNNRVVLFYETSKLILLNIRHNETGEYLKHEEIQKNEILSKVLVKSKEFTNKSAEEFVDEVLNMKNIEGFVGILNDGTWFKLKTYWYSSLHRTKDNLLSPEKTLTAIANDAYDDLYSLVDGNGEKNYVNKANEIYKNFMNESFMILKESINENASLDRKDYAIKGQQIFERRYLFSIYMNCYNKGFDEDFVYESLKQSFIKNVKDFADFADL